MPNGTQSDEPKTKLKELLKELFQCDFGELDFGIYRIMNYRRREIEKFIDEDLIEIVDKEFEKFKEQNKEELLKKLSEKENEIKKTEENLGEKILENGEIIGEYKNKKIGKEYIQIKEELKELKITEDIQNQVFRDIYNFFSRYYEEGDFVSKPRRNREYVIPYNGEDVKLYWANYDQYYVKTGEIFKNYEFETKGWKFIFQTVIAEVEVGNIKGQKKYFFLATDNPIEIDEHNHICCIKFGYRPFTDKDKDDYKIKTKEGKEKDTGIKQDEINPLLEQKIIEEIGVIVPKALLMEKIKVNEKEITFLQKHLKNYTKKNTSDFFIHKNLKKFLERELDYYVKSEILDINNLDKRKITEANVIKNISEKIIEFLAQIEEFQKVLWEKKKFVLKTEYVITTDRIPEEFYKEILDNEEQSKEWENLGFYLPANTEDLKKIKLPIDTKYFNQEFKEKLLEKITESADLDDILDGLLIKSENWQALNLLSEKYKEQVQTIYIDPPFNKEHDADYLYNVKYKNSTWATLLENRLSLTRNLMNYRGSIFVRCDYNGNWIVRPLMNDIFGKENFRNEITINRTQEFFKSPGKEPKKYMWDTDSLFLFSKTENNFFRQILVERKEEIWWEPFLPSKSKPEDDFRIVLGQKVYSPPGRKWGLKQEDINCLESEGRIRRNNKGRVEYFPKYIKLKDNWTDIAGYQRMWNFDTENAEILLKRVIETTSNPGDVVFDFFLGSGTTTAVAHKLGRKWLGVEMGEHFYSVVLPRMKKVLFYDKSGISKDLMPRRTSSDTPLKEGNYQGGGFFKYYELEQYEEALANCKYDDNDLFSSPFVKGWHSEGMTGYFKTPYQEYVFMKDEKMLKALEIDYENEKVKVDLSQLYPNIDIAETLSNLTGKWIKKISDSNVEFEDGTKINIKDLDYKLIKPLVWWE